jgi:hypothetical protein
VTHTPPSPPSLTFFNSSPSSSTKQTISGLSFSSLMNPGALAHSVGVRSSSSMHHRGSRDVLATASANIA